MTAGEGTHWQLPGRETGRATCHGRRTREPVTTRPAGVTCPACQQSNTWKQAAVAVLDGGPCPDCQAPDGRLCHHWCPRYTEPAYYDEPPPEEETA